MAKHAKYKLDGWIAEDATKMTDALDRVLQDTGAYAVQEMKAITSKHDASGRLSDSLMYATDKGITSAIQGSHSEDALETPTGSKDSRILIAGSGAPHAIYREKYSGIHKHFEGHEEFEESMKEWCKEVLGIDPDRSPGEAFDFAMILEHIRNTNTEGDPFIEPNKEKILKYALTQYKLSLQKFMNSKAHKEG